MKKRRWDFDEILMRFDGILMEFDWIYPLVNSDNELERSTMLLMGKLTISTGPFSIAILNYQRVREKMRNEK